jgi:4-hydroxybenzoyl-CoA reductase subunit beta
MLLPEHQYVKAASLDDCLTQLSTRGDGTRLVAGGTDVIFNMRLKLFQPEVALSIRNLRELQQVEELPDGGLRLGAGCRLAVLEQDTRLRARYPAFADAVHAVASTHVRNMATLGGNLCLETRCWYTNNSEQWREGVSGCFKTDGQLCHVIKSSSVCHAINNADTPVALMALDAALTLQSVRGARQVPIADFYRRDGLQHTVLAADELVTHVTLPPISDRTIFLKIAPRTGMDFAVATVAARVDGHGERATRCTLVAGSLSTAPVLLKGPAATVAARGLGDAAIEAAVEQVRDELGELTNLYGRPGYKKHLANVLVRRALTSLREQ